MNALLDVSIKFLVKVLSIDNFKVFLKKKMQSSKRFHTTREIQWLSKGRILELFLELRRYIDILLSIISSQN